MKFPEIQAVMSTCVQVTPIRVLHQATWQEAKALQLLVSSSYCQILCIGAFNSHAVIKHVSCIAEHPPSKVQTISLWGQHPSNPIHQYISVWAEHWQKMGPYYLPLPHCHAFQDCDLGHGMCQGCHVLWWCVKEKLSLPSMIDSASGDDWAITEGTQTTPSSRL